MRPLKLTILLLILTIQLFSQEVRQYEDYYESGKIYVRGSNIQVDSISSADIGLWIYWYENGNKLSEEIRNDSHLTKYINCWTGKGKQICTNGNGKFYQTWTDIGFIDDSTIYTIKDSIKQGRFICFVPYNNKRIKRAKGNYVNGQRQGKVIYFYETGEILSTETYVDDKENGLQKEFYKNGKLKEQGLQKQGIQDSIWTYYNSQSILEKSMTYERGRSKHLVEYYLNGIVKSEGDFTQIKVIPKKDKFSKKLAATRGAKKMTNGSLTVKNGEWVYFDKTGQLIKKETYSNGKLTKNGM